MEEVAKVTKPSENVERPLAPLIRAPNMGIAARPSPGSRKPSPRQNVSIEDSSDPVISHKRREKLRAVLELMGRGSKMSTRLRERDRRDREPKDGREGSAGWSLLAAGVRGEITGPDGKPLMRGHARRHAIADGRLPIKSPRIDTGSTGTDAELEPPIRLRKFGKMRTIAKIVLLLMRMCRTYILTENDAKMVKLFSAIDAAQAGDKYKIRGDLLFDVTAYKAKKQNNISSETRRVLEMPTSSRTEKDIHHVQVELQQMEFITKYPVQMQRSLIRTGAFESYESGRVIIRHGRRPYAFYLVLGGSALSLEGDPENSGRPANALLKGHVFGHEAIVSRGRHNITVISKEHIQLLSLTVEEYSRIFLAGGVSNISGVDGSSFIESVSIFQGWPLHLLKKHPKKCRFNYFTRGTVIEPDSTHSDWIYVLKSGSCAVMKRLHHEDPLPTKRKKYLPSISSKAATSLSMSHEDQITNKLRDLQRKRAKALKGKSRRLKDTRPKNIVRIPMRDDPLSTTTDTPHHASSSTTVNHALVASLRDACPVPAIVVSDSSRPDSPPSPLPDAQSESGSESPQSSPGGNTTPECQTKTAGDEGANFRGRSPRFSRGPFLTHTKRLPSINEAKQSSVKSNPGWEPENTAATTSQSSTSQNNAGIDTYHPPLKESTIVSESVDIGHTEPSIDPLPSVAAAQPGDEFSYHKSSATTNMGRDMFVQVDTLERGAIFGVSDIVFGNQPSLCLVSNGAECVLIAKKFYAKHATEKNLKAITDLLRPYPTEDTLLRDLREKLTWQDHRDKTLLDTARSLRRHRRKSLPGIGMHAPTTLSMSTSGH